MMIWCFSAVLSLAMGVGLVLLITTAIAHYYELSHPIVIGEDDMGYGVIMMLRITAVSIITLPLVVFCTIFLKKMIFKLTNEKQIFLQLVTFLLLLLLVCFWLYSPRSTALESVFAKELALFKESGKSSLDLRLLLGSSWKMVCMQHPYQHQDNFEKTINRGVNTLWVFYNDGTVKWLQIKRVSVMDFDYDEGTRCTSFEHPVLYSHWIKYASWQPENKFYFLDSNNKGEN